MLSEIRSSAGRLAAFAARVFGAHGGTPVESSDMPSRFAWLTVLLALAPAFAAAPYIIAKIPFSHDHATHLFKVWHFWTELVPSGRLRGWSHYWAFGSPSDELVPCGGEVWVGIFRGLTLGLLSWARTYAVAFAGLMLLKSYAFYRFGRAFFGPSVGVLAAWFAFFEPGEMLEGGWEWHTNWGVWPVTLATSLLQLAFVRLKRILDDRRAGDVLAAGLLVGCALLTHQIVMVALVLTLPLLFADHLLRPDPPSFSACFRALGAVLVGCALSGFFLVPFFTHTDDTLDLGWLHAPLSVASQRFFEGKTFQNMPVVLHVLGLLGMFLALRDFRRGGLFFAASAIACVLLASDVLVRTLHLERLLPSLVKLEVNRLLLVAKLFWFPLAAHALAVLITFGKGAFTSDGAAQRIARLAIAGILLVPLLLPAGRELVRAHVRKPVTGLEDLADWRDFRRLSAWLRNEQARSARLFRVVYDVGRGNHLPTVLPAFDRTPLYKVGTTPTQIFKRIPRAADPDLYEAMLVKYVVRPDRDDSPYLRFVQRFGSLWVYDFLRYRSEPFTVLGAGRGELLEFSPETIRIRLRGTNSETRLKLHVAAYSRWRALLDGKELSIGTVPVYGFRYPFLMEVPARDGELVFEYVRRPADWVGLLLSLAALPLFFLVRFLHRRGRLRFERISSLVARHSGVALVVGLFLLLGASGAVFARTRSRANVLPRTSLFHDLGSSELSLAGEVCERLEPLVFRCGGARIEADVVATAVWGIHLCMHGPRPGPLELRTRRKLGAFLSGSYDVSAAGDGRIRVRVDGRELADFPTEPPYLQQQFVAFDTRDLEGKTALVEITLEGAALDCFDFGVVR